MPAHPRQRVRAWIAQNYQKPAVDEEWLADCADWLSSELGLDPATDFDQFIQHVEAQLLQSNLADSTVHGSGIDPLLVAPSPPRRPTRQPPRQKKTTGPTPLLVEIKSITEIAHSAFSLLNTHQTRLDRADLGLARDDDPDQHQHQDEDEGPVPRFPRGMLRFELSDGLTTFKAIEFRSLPQLELGTTPLGYKILLKSTPIRNGIAFLEPANVVLKGFRTEDHDVNSEQVFLSSLRKRLGRPDPPPEAPVPTQSQLNAPAPPHQQAPLAARPQSLPADIDDMYLDDEVDPDVLREMNMQMDADLAVQENVRPATRAPPPAKPASTSRGKHAASSNSKPVLPPLNTSIASSGPSTASTAKTSSYFTAHLSDSRPIPDIGLSPRPALSPSPESDFDITWDVPDMDSPYAKDVPASARPQSPVQTNQVIPSRKRSSSPDPYDDLLFDMDVDASFFEQIGKIEQGALGTGINNKGKGKGKEIGTVVEGTNKRSTVACKRTPTSSTLGTKSLAPCSVSPSGAESNTRRATSTSSLSGSMETVMPRSTQSSNRRLPRDPSLIIISSSEDETPTGGRGAARPLDLVRRRSRKRPRVDRSDVAESDVIDISD